MRRRVEAVGIMAVTAVMMAAGCTQTVFGAARPALTGASDPNRSYGYEQDRCGLLLDSTVAEVLGADDVVRPYSGAVCQYVLSRPSGSGTPATTIDVVYSWFETGSLDRERALAQQRGATVTDIVVERHPAFSARRDSTGAACSATAAAGSGVLSWWVQFRGQRAGDPCPAAEKLLTSTLRSDM